MKASCLLLCLFLAGCGGSSKQITDSDRRDAKLVLTDLKLPIGAVTDEQAHLSEAKSHQEGNLPLSTFAKAADATRTKYKGSAIEPEVSKLCVDLAAYWELPSGNDPKAKSAAAEVEKDRAALQAVADGK